MMKKTIATIIILLAGGFAIVKFNPFAPRPCAKPIQYSLGTFDAQFGISQDQFLADVNKAVAIWDAPLNKQLFQYAPGGKLKINLIYDYRQQATDKLKSLGLTIDDSESSYNALRARYDSMKLDYSTGKQNLDVAVADYQKQRQAYEQAVNYWNAQGGADRATVEKLNQQREQLNKQAQAITQAQTQLAALVDNINALANTLNRIGSALNKNVSAYNTVGQSRGDEFEEGLYTSDSSGQKIDIYEYDNQNKLVRVLAHELGHALGLEHNSNPEAIMYRLNQGKNEKLTADDIFAVKQLCGIQ